MHMQNIFASQTARLCQDNPHIINCLFKKNTYKNKAGEACGKTYTRVASVHTDSWSGLNQFKELRSKNGCKAEMKAVHL